MLPRSFSFLSPTPPAASSRICANTSGETMEDRTVTAETAASAMMNAGYA